MGLEEREVFGVRRDSPFKNDVRFGEILLVLQANGPATGSVGTVQYYTRGELRAPTGLPVVDSAAVLARFPDTTMTNNKLAPCCERTRIRFLPS